MPKNYDFGSGFFNRIAIIGYCLQVLAYIVSVKLLWVTASDNLIGAFLVRKKIQFLQFF